MTEVTKDPPMASGRAMGLDVGSRRIGVALSDPTRTIAQPFGVVDGRRSDAACRELCAIAREHEVGIIIVGLPLQMNGREGTQARVVRRFVDVLRKMLDAEVQIELWDERLTSRQAERALQEGGVGSRKARTVVDQIAASIILGSYLAARRSAFS
ncbi:MAG: Holliday junction resolvase RuvX [Myxococcales bacterium]|nr:Holliday junction resolvase RuvX [Myxococcales bacterium]